RALERAGQRCLRRVRRRVRRDHANHVAAVGDRRGIPDDDFIVEALLERLPLGITLATVEDVVDELVAVVVGRAPREGEQAFLIDTAPDARTAGASTRLRPLAIRDVAVEAGDLRITGGEGTLAHRSWRV